MRAADWCGRNPTGKVSTEFKSLSYFLGIAPPTHRKDTLKAGHRNTLCLIEVLSYMPVWVYCTLVCSVKQICCQACYKGQMGQHITSHTTHRYILNWYHHHHRRRRNPIGFLPEVWSPLQAIVHLCGIFYLPWHRRSGTRDHGF
jgi:hypothetical protein